MVNKAYVCPLLILTDSLNSLLSRFTLIAMTDGLTKREGIGRSEME